MDSFPMSHVGTPFSPFFCFTVAVRPERERKGGGGRGAIRLRPVCLDSG